MANAEQLALLNAEGEGWNKWRIDQWKDCKWTVKVDLRLADLSGTQLEGANLEEANLCKANLAHPPLHDADLRNAILTGAKLGEAKLRKALFCADHSGGRKSLCDDGRSAKEL